MVNKVFTKPELEIVRFEVEDVITKSGILPEIVPEMGDGGAGSGGSTGF